MSASGSTATAVCGIPCRLRTELARHAVSRVLGRIGKRFPDDFARLSDRVRMIRPLPKRRAADGTHGEWIARTFEQIYWNADPFELSDEIRLQWDEWHSGVVEVLEVGRTESQLLAVIAHELGHACSTREDISRRAAPFDEWGSEAAADWYAYRWGFGRYIGAGRKSRSLGHHGPGPGKTVDWSGEQGTTTYKLTSNFVYRLIPPDRSRNAPGVASDAAEAAEGHWAVRPTSRRARRARNGVG